MEREIDVKNGGFYEQVCRNTDGKEFESSICRGVAGEKQLYFAEIAKKEGYEQIAAIFEKTADNERAHAQMWGEELGLVGDTGKNLDAAATGRTMSGQTCMRILQNGGAGRLCGACSAISHGRSD